MDFINTTVASNSATYNDGGIQLITGGTITLHNTIVADNTDVNYINIDGTVDTTNSNNNLIGTYGTGGLATAPMVIKCCLVGKALAYWRSAISVARRRRCASSPPVLRWTPAAILWHLESMDSRWMLISEDSHVTSMPA